MAALGWITFTLGATIGLTVLRGIVLQALWSWFVAETFDIITLTLPQAIGLTLIVSYLTYQYDARQPDEPGDYREKAVTSVLAGLLICGMSYLVGALVHSFA